MSLWCHPRPLVLASQSDVRRQLLEAAGLPVIVRPAAIDERAVELHAGSGDPAAVAVLLAAAKAETIASSSPEHVVVGADQTLALEGRRFSKPRTRGEARAQLVALRGATHTLSSAIAVSYNGAVMFRHVATARLTMRCFTDDFLEHYLDETGEAAYQSVGSYQLENTGIHLFETVDGDHFTILGLPLLPLLNFFRAQGWVAQ